MTYQRDTTADVAADDGLASPVVDSLHLIEAIVNPTTGLATDYLNTFNEPIMLLEMLSSAPEFRDDFLNWQPVSYRDHFAMSHHETRNAVIAAYESANQQSRACLELLTDTMTAMLEATRAILATDLPPAKASAFAGEAAAALKPLVARAGAVINGEAYLEDTRAPQATVDELMEA